MEAKRSISKVEIRQGKSTKEMNENRGKEERGRDLEFDKKHSMWNGGGSDGRKKRKEPESRRGDKKRGTERPRSGWEVRNRSGRLPE